MGELYEWMMLAKQKEPEAILRILNQFEPKLKQSLFKTTLQEREDLKQELQIKLIKAMEQFDTTGIPGFFEYIKEKKDQEKNYRRK